LGVYGPDVLGRFVLGQNDEDVMYMNVKTQADVILAMKRRYAQAGGLSAKKAQALLDSGAYEIGYPFPLLRDLRWWPVIA